MIRKELMDSFMEHPFQAMKTVRQYLSERPFSPYSEQDVLDTREAFMERFPGLASKLKHGLDYSMYPVGKYRRVEVPVYKEAYAEHVKKSFTPKVLVFDIETAPLTAYVWKRWKENVSLDQTISEWFMLAWSAKWLYSTEIMGDVLTPEEALRQDDRRIVEHLWRLVDEADIVIAFNGLNFDVPRMNTSFLACGLQPPRPYIVIDPMKTLKSRFGLSSNKLDSLAMLFGIETKLHTDFDLWKRCMQGDAEALGYMLEYNKKDVDILEEVYLRLRPWIVNHPNIANLVERDVCPFCGVEEPGILLEGAYYYTGVNSYQLYRCPECGAIYRSRKATHNFSPGSSTVVMH